MSLRYIPWCGTLAALLVVPLFASDYRVFQVGVVASTSIIALGLIFVTGIAGQVSLAQAAFCAIGGYGCAVLASRFDISPWLGIPLSAAMAGALGYILGLATLRLGGHYLALVTLALTAIVQVILVQWETVTGGALGLSVTPLRVFGKELTSAVALFYVVVPAAFLMFLFAANLLESRIGRAWSALRQSEAAAQILGHKHRSLQIVGVCVERSLRSARRWTASPSDHIPGSATIRDCRVPSFSSQLLSSAGSEPFWEPYLGA